jgi:simple sugar transport system ATP-binding protein
MSTVTDPPAGAPGTVAGAGITGATGSQAGLAVMRGVARRFGSTVAVDGVDLTLRAGEIHALLGANGAGKTTLVRILAGLDRPDGGTVTIAGEAVGDFEPRALRGRGVALVQQHFTLVPTLTPSENLVLARPGSRLLPRRRAAGRRLGDLIERYGLSVRDGVPAGQLSVGEQQRLELLRALDAGARVLLLDEPTAVLTDHEAELLLATCRALAAEGRALAFITHRLGEVFAGCDRVSVLREGRQIVDDEPVSSHSRSSLATAMIGTERGGRIECGAPSPEPPPGTSSRLAVAGLTSGRLRDVTIDIAPGEIVGVAGVDGNGQADLEAAVSGRLPADAGSVRIEGSELPTGDPRARRSMGLAYIPSDRYRWGLVRAMDLADNLELGRVPRWRASRARRRAGAEPALGSWDVRSRGPAQLAGTLSGGNAQKLVLARELDGEPRAVLACYPTRGLDPAAAGAVAERLARCAADGAAVLWIGAELDELLAVADRIVVFASGAAKGPFLPPFDRHAIGIAMTGGESRDAAVLAGDGAAAGGAAGDGAGR